MQRCTANSCTAQGTGERTRVCTSHFTVFTTQGSSFTPTRFLRHRAQVRILFWGLCLWIPDPAFKLDTKFKYVYVGESSCSWLLSSGGVLCSHLYRDCTVGKTFIQHCVSDAGCLIISWFWFADWNSPATPHLKIHLFFFFTPLAGTWLLSADCLLSVPAESLMWEPSTLRFMCLLFRYAQNPKKDHGRWGLFFLWQLMSARAAPLMEATVDVCTTDTDVSVKQNMTHESLRVLFIGWQCHLRFSTKLCVQNSCNRCWWMLLAIEADNRELNRKTEKKNYNLTDVT